MRRTFKFIWHFALSICVICTALSLIAQITPVATQQSLGVHRMYDVTVQGKCKGDVIQLLDGAIGSGSATLTSASANFRPQDVGKQITVLGAGAAGASMTTVIDARPDAHTLTLHVSAGTTVTGALFYYGTDDSTAFANAYTAAKAQGYKRLYIPAARYLVGTSTPYPGVIASTDDDFEIMGDGMGKTIFQYASNLSFNTSFAVVHVSANRQQVHDFTIIGPYSITNGGGSPAFYGVSASAGGNNVPGCFQPHVYNVEVTNVPALGTNGAGITMSQAWDTPEYVTTLGTAVVAPGAATVTPPAGGMKGIYLGRALRIGGTQGAAYQDGELVIVTAVTTTTWTGTFAGTHAANESVMLSSDGRINGLIENCWVHDCPGGQGFGVSASGVTIRKNRIRNIGFGNSLLHGMYLQGGETVVQDNIVESVGGFAIHCHKSTPNFDCSGDRVFNNVCVDYQSGGIVIDNATSTASNPMVPVGSYLNRFNLISGNVCRTSFGMPYFNGSGISAQTSTPTIITGNMLEDACGNQGSATGTWINAGSTNDVTISNNILRSLFADAKTVISATGLRAMVSGNKLMTETSASLINVGQFGIVSKNQIYFTGRLGLTPLTVFAVGANSKVCDNMVDIQKGAGATSLFSATSFTNIQVTNNYVSDNNNNLGNTNLINLGNGPSSGEFSGNFFADANGNPTGYLRYVTAFPGLKLSGNYGVMAYGGSTGPTLDKGVGDLFAYPVGTNSLTSDLLCTLDANGCARNCTVSDTTFIGAATSANSSGSSGKVTYALMASNGSGYSSQETCTFAASAGTQATGTCNMGALSATIGAGGTGYNPGDLLTGTTGTGTKFVFQVVTAPSGVVTAVQVIIPGDYTTLPASPSPTSVDYPHAGTGCTLAVTWGVHSITMTNNGTQYVTPPAITFGGAAGGTGAKATSYISSVYLMGKVGSEIPLQADAAWTSGNIGILSITSGGKIHDMGAGLTVATSPPGNTTAVGASVSVAGTGHAVGDVITLTATGGTTTTAVKVTSVDGGGGVTGFVITTGGVYQSPPANPSAQTATTGVGINFSANIVYGQPSYVRFLNSGGAAGTARCQILRTQ